MTRRLRHLVFVLPLLSLLGGGAAEAMLRCQHDHVLRVTCCCPKTKPAPDGAVLARGRCCTIERTADAAPAPAQPASPETARPIPVAVVVLAPPSPSLACRARPVAALARAPDKPSLFAQKTSFLL